VTRRMEVSGQPIQSRETRGVYGEGRDEILFGSFISCRPSIFYAEKQHEVGRSSKPALRAALSRGRPDFVSLWKNFDVICKEGNVLSGGVSRMRGTGSL